MSAIGRPSRIRGLNTALLEVPNEGPAVFCAVQAEGYTRIEFPGCRDRVGAPFPTILVRGDIPELSGDPDSPNRSVADLDPLELSGFGAVLAKARGGELWLSHPVEDEQSIRVSCGRSQLLVDWIDPDSFSEVPSPGDVGTWQSDAAKLRDEIEAVRRCTTRKRSERFATDTVRFLAGADHFGLAATTGRILAMAKVPATAAGSIPVSPVGWHVSGSLLGRLTAFLGRLSGPVEWGFFETHLFVRVPGAEMGIRLSAGGFPKVEEGRPAGRGRVLAMDASQAAVFSRCFHEAAIVCEGESRRVELVAVRGEPLVFSARSAAGEAKSETGPALIWEGPRTSILIDSASFRRILSWVGPGPLDLTTWGRNDPFLLSRLDGPEYLSAQLAGADA